MAFSFSMDFTPMDIDPPANLWDVRALTSNLQHLFLGNTIPQFGHNSHNSFQGFFGNQQVSINSSHELPRFHGAPGTSRDVAQHEPSARTSSSNRPPINPDRALNLNDRRILPLPRSRTAHPHDQAHLPNNPLGFEFNPPTGPRFPRPPRHYKPPYRGDHYRPSRRRDSPTYDSYRPGGRASGDVMADYEDDRRDRGRNRGGGGNKRRRYDDDDDSYGRRDPQRRRQNPRDGDNHYAPRREGRLEEPFSKLRRLLINIASSSKLPQTEGEEIAAVLAESWDEEKVKTDFFDVWVQLILEQPFKIPFVAGVAFIVNHEKPEIASTAIERVAERTQEALKAGQWKEFKLLLRFFACLQSLFENDGIFTLLEQLFDTVVDLQSANENDVVGIELVKIILLTIPYALVAGGPRFHAKAQELLQKTEIVAENTLAIERVIEAYVSEKPIPYHSVIGLLQTQLSNEAESGWEFAFIPRFQAPIPKTDEGALATGPAMHPFPSFAIPSPVNQGPKPLFPEAFISLYVDQEIETVPRIGDIAGSIIRDSIVDTIDQLDFNRDAVAKFLVELDCYWSVHTFAKRAIAFDRFKEEQKDKIVWKSEDMIIDAIFSQLLKLPAPEHKLVYYHSLITQCCKIAPAAIAPSLGRAIRFIYKNLDFMDLELSYRFLDWFSHHLSNFEFRWRWAEWEEYLDLPNLHPKKAFIIAALDKEMRLSFAKRVRSTLPEPYHPLIPARLDDDNSPDFKYEDPSTPFSEEGKTLLHQLKKKAAAEDIQATITAIHTKAAEAKIADVHVASTDALVTAICRLGAKSMSHLLSAIERGKEPLLSIAGRSDAAKRQIVASVVEYWKDQPGVAVNIIDKILNYRLVEPIHVVQWALGDHLGAGEPLSESWVFEMVAITVTKVRNRNQQIVTARLVKKLSPEQVHIIEEALLAGRMSTRDIFRFIEDAVSGYAQGAADRLIEKEASGELSPDDVKLIAAWAKRWQIVFQRKAQVEERVISEESVDAKIRQLEAEPEAEPEGMVEGNGAVEDANGDTEML